MRQTKGKKEGWTMPDTTVDFRQGEGGPVDEVKGHGAVPEGWTLRPPRARALDGPFTPPPPEDPKTRRPEEQATTYE